jgi:hypothetical protein
VKGWLWAFAVATVLVALVLGAFLAGGLPELLPPGSAIVIEGERHEIGDVSAVLAEYWVAAVIGVLIVAAVLVVVVPLVVALSVVLPLLGGALGFATALLAIAIVASPIILLGRWLWMRPAKNARRMQE